MLGLGIRYVRGVAVAADPGGFDRPEWPPHPARVFMAMAAAHFEMGGDAAERAALEWLEALDEAPQIRAADATKRDVVVRFVPVNDTAGPSKAILQSAPGFTRDRAARTFPTALPADDQVYLIWKAECPRRHLDALAQVCGKVTRIGHSSSFVQMWVDPRPPEATWLPVVDSAAMYVRAIAPGLLRYLEECANVDRIREYGALEDAASRARGNRRREVREEMAARFPGGAPIPIRPAVSVWQGYAPVEPGGRPTVPASVWDRELLVLRLDALEGSARHLDLVATLQLTQRFHEAVLSRCAEPAPEFISGHSGESPTEQPHLAYMPLPVVGTPYSDGLIRGLAVAAPRGLTRPQRRAVLTAVGGIAELRLGPLGRWSVKPDDRDPPPAAMISTTWVGGRGGSRTWATVTPIAFDRHSKFRDRSPYEKEVCGMIASACERIRLPAPETVVTTPASAHLGAPAAHEFPRLRRKDGSLRRHTHAVITFPEPVTGPVLLGAGRYRGYGLCKPLRVEGAR